MSTTTIQTDFVSKTCEGELCSVCRAPAKHKMEETIAFDDPNPARHPLTAYVCRKHFNFIMNGGLRKREQ